MSEERAKYFMPEPPSSGWSFSICPVGEPRSPETVLASWYAKTGGRRWIEDLEAEGKAMATPALDNFHGQYLVKLVDLMPFLDAPPHRREHYQYQHHPDRIEACGLEAIVHVTVFDQS